MDIFIAKNCRENLLQTCCKRARNIRKTRKIWLELKKEVPIKALLCDFKFKNGGDSEIRWLFKIAYNIKLSLLKIDHLLQICYKLF